MELAIIKTGGKQYIVAPGQKLRVEKLDGAEGDQGVFDEVLLAVEKDKTQIGQPRVSGVKVSAKILKQDRADKITILKYKSKKRSKIKRGHRQPYTLVEIEAIK